MANWQEITLGVIEEVLALVLIFIMYLFVKIFMHKTTSFYSRISALLLSAAAFISVIRLSIDGYIR